MSESEETITGGLYEDLVTIALASRLSQIEERRVRLSPLNPAEAADRIALHLGRQIQTALASLPAEHRVPIGISLAKNVIEMLSSDTRFDAETGSTPNDPGEVLREVSKLLPDGSLHRIVQPLTPLLDTTLLTNAPGEPRVGKQIETEIDSSGDIDLVMAFIRKSGIQSLVPALRQHCLDGRKLRVLTTTYTGSTERVALELLVDLGAEVKVSYDITSTRLHAKAWLFNRERGYSTAYIGSSNLTHTAQGPGLEWNVRVSGARNPDVIEKIRAVFSAYWENPDFRDFDSKEFEERTAVTTKSGPNVFLSPVGIRPLPFQERLLEQLAVARSQGHYRNLLVAATGTGKTVMAALDYSRLKDSTGNGRLLFVAHRKEILDQSHATFRHAMHDHDFGEQWVGGRHPSVFNHVFASIQSLNASDLQRIAPDHFDVVIVDEFHHSAASTYRRLLNHLQPKQLLGLTATPERGDGLSVLGWFDGRIAGELRLWDAIDQQYLSPFSYFGIHDGTDLRKIPWRRGAGYETSDLTNVYTASDQWAELVLSEYLRRVDDPEQVRALGFCVGVEHARHMARIFNKHGVTAVAISGDTPQVDREAALKDLAGGSLKVLFSVDLFNEGVDVPSVNTLLLLRPTDSPTLYLQQLGRGLRRSENKPFCLILDFVGQHRKEFRFDRTLRALLGGSRRDIEQQVRQGFPLLPVGCAIDLDKKSSEVILSSIRNALPSRWAEKVEELKSLAGSNPTMDLKEFLTESGLDLDDVYANNRSWSDLREDAGLAVMTPGPSEVFLRRALGRMLHIDDHLRLDAYSKLLNSPHSAGDSSNLKGLDSLETRVSRMFTAQLVDQIPREQLPSLASVDDALSLIRAHPQVCAEALELFEVLTNRIDHLHEGLPHRTNCPVQIHARYTRTEILAAFNHTSGARTSTWQAGVIFLPEESVDLFAVTLDKSSGSFSPTTRYRDYAISQNMFHWESQSPIRSDGTTGLRYQNHTKIGSDVIIFARLRQSDRSFWCLGPASYKSHEGERPMAITWRLDYPLPGDLFSEFAAAVA
jgi:superfamily II DNA or RNA helicase/HKD family nuclease